MANTYTLISSNVLGSIAASVTFSAIPSTYTDLVVRCSVREQSGGGSTGALVIKYNADSTTKYSYTLIRSNSAATSSARASNQSSGDLNDAIDGSIATDYTYSSNEIYIPNYTSTSGKPTSAFSVTENNSVASNDAFINAHANLYTGTSAISSIAFTTGTTFRPGSSFYLYGIKNS